MQFYNTLSSRKEEFTPLVPGKVGMYVCGPTVYDYDHLGHARTYLAFDLIHRFLRYTGNDVTYVQNITDVGHLVGDAETGADKIAERARDTGQGVQEIADQFAEAHAEDMAALNVLEPTKAPKASEHITEIIEFITGLMNKGVAYVTPSQNVYFSVGKDPDYGKLSHRGLAEIITGTRVEPAHDKRSPADFALWKGAPMGATEMVWESPWGKGYPGWHIECSAMSRKYLGDTFDIHGSAMEHIFPHHENEIAQSETLTGQPMARFWIHSGMLSIGEQKMSKSLHNMVLIREALKNYSANEVRLAFYQTHYRRPFSYTKEVMEQGMALRRKLFTAYANAGDKDNQEIFTTIIDALNDDLDTPEALRLWTEASAELSKAQFEKLFDIFGLKYMPIENNPQAQQLAHDRNEARSKNDFLTADNRKAELLQSGFEVLDTPEGTTYLPR
jgi:cysteinyl-tRNA synthetase